MLTADVVRQATCARFEALSHAILAAEELLASGEGQLSETFEDPRLRAVYERRLALELPPLPFRRPAVETLLSRARALLTPERLVVPAEGEAVRHEVGSAVRFEAQLTTGAGKGALRWTLKAICDVRFWGIDIRPVDPAAHAVVEESVLSRVVQSLESDLSSLAKIERRFAQRELPAEMEVVSTGEGEAFERLLVELLDEPPWQARQANLAEDFLEKTDLRVMHPELGRQRGARIQVALTGSRTRNLSKREQIRSAEEFVHLSPWTLAEALVAGLLSEAETEALHQVLSTQGRPAAELAWALRRHFLAAIRDPGDDPRGPSVLIPESVCRLVRAYVAREAGAATRALRDNEARRGRNQPAPAAQTGEALPDEAAPAASIEVR